MINLFTRRKKRKREKKREIAEKIQEVDINILSIINDVREPCVKKYELFLSSNSEAIRHMGIRERKDAKHLEEYMDKFIDEYKYLENNYNNHDLKGLNKLLEDRLSTYNSIEGRDPFAILHKLAGYEFITEGCDNNDDR